ncbi:hypothetical protein HYT23_00395 [Candidatus Pacearchaeota archaeon]|nr:hypothetical protein [Candidatus Pacearchaeota archaeon]
MTHIEDLLKDAITLKQAFDILKSNNKKFVIAKIGGDRERRVILTQEDYALITTTRDSDFIVEEYISIHPYGTSVEYLFVED